MTARAENGIKLTLIGIVATAVLGYFAWLSVGQSEDNTHRTITFPEYRRDMQEYKAEVAREIDALDDRQRDILQGVTRMEGAVEAIYNEVKSMRRELKE